MGIGAWGCCYCREDDTGQPVKINAERASSSDDCRRQPPTNSAREVFSGLVPPKENANKRDRFMKNGTDKDTYSKDALDALVVKNHRSKFCCSARCRTHSKSIVAAPRDLVRDDFKTSSRGIQRIPSFCNVAELSSWWGMPSKALDPKLEADLPGYILVTELVSMMCTGPDHIQNLRDQIQLDDLCRDGEKYVLWQVIAGKNSLLSLHHVLDEEAYEKMVHAQGGNLLKDSLKYIVRPVNLAVKLPMKGPKAADTIGNFFGMSNTHCSRCRPGESGCKYDITMISFDLYSVWSLKMALPHFAFGVGRICDYHLVSYRDNAVLATYRLAMTREAAEQLSKEGYSVLS